MKVKVLILSLVLCAAITTHAHSFGLGAQFNFRVGDDPGPGASLAISPSRTMHFAVNWYTGSENVNTLGLTMDLLALPRPHARGLSFVLGGGIFTNAEFADDVVFSGGVRVPIGLNLLLIQRTLEIYTHVAPSFGVHFTPTLGFASPFFPIALGARIWLR